MQILDVKIDNINLKETIDKILDWLDDGGQHYVATVNPEFVVEAQKNNEFKKILNEADLATCDGMGLVYAGLFLYGKKLTRVTGVDLVKELLESKTKNQEPRIFLLGGDMNGAKKVAEKYPSNVVGFMRGGQLDVDNYLLDDNNKVIEKINQSGSNILLVGLGQVKQEMWISKNLNKLQNVKVAIGVGGTFDYLSGNVKRANKIFRGVGLEWFVRLVTQPKRFSRIWRAVIVFPLLVVKEKILKIKN